MQYIKIKFTKGLDCEAYQEIANGEVVVIKDINGKILDITNTESHVIDSHPSFPAWGVKSMPVIAEIVQPISEPIKDLGT